MNQEKLAEIFKKMNEDDYSIKSKIDDNRLLFKVLKPDGNFNVYTGVVNDEGDWIVEINRGSLYFSEKSIFVNRYDIRYGSTKWSVLDFEGNYIHKLKFKKFHPNNYDNVETALVLSGNKWSLIDSKGNFIHKDFFSQVKPFYNNRSIVRHNKKYGLIDYTGKWLLEPKYKKLYTTLRNGPEHNRLIEIIHDNNESEKITI